VALRNAPFASEWTQASDRQGAKPWALWDVTTPRHVSVAMSNATFASEGEH